MVILAVIFGMVAGGGAAWLWQAGRQGALRERVKWLTTQLETERSAQERISNEFKALSADALRVNRTDFLEQAQQVFRQLHQQSTGELEQRKLAVEGLVKPLRESLEKVDGRIVEMEKSRASAYGALGEQLKTLTTAQMQWQAEAAKLSTALRSTTYAGSWGEFRLRRVVEMADMLPYCDFTEQETSGSLRADLVVRLPGGQKSTRPTKRCARSAWPSTARKSAAISTRSAPKAIGSSFSLRQSSSSSSSPAIISSRPRSRPIPR
jgi:DNA anti-recombination protein RmuC